MPANVADALAIGTKICLFCILMRNEVCLF